MEFEWDVRKAAQNIAKHGVPFEYAARVFVDPRRLDHKDDRRDYSGSGGLRSARLRVGFLLSLMPHDVNLFG